MISDLRYACRQLLKTPGFTLVAVGTLVLGIGASTTLFSVFDTLVLHPTSLPGLSRLTQLWVTNAEANFNAPAMSWPRFEMIREQQSVFSDVAVSSFTSPNLTGQGDPEQLTGLAVTSGFLPTLGLQPLRGRNFTAEDDVTGGPPVAMVSYSYWQSRFGGREDLVGSTILLDGVAHTVVGIVPPTFGNPFNTVQVTTPRPNVVAGLTAEQIARGAGYLQAVARLKPGVTLEQAQKEMDLISPRYEAAFGDFLDAHNQIVVRDFTETLVGNLRPTFRLLLGTVAGVMLIACANVSGLFLGRLGARRKEIVVRLSVGATRGRLIRLFLVESLLFSALAGVIGTLIAVWTLSLIENLATTFLPTGTTLHLSPAALGFTVGLSFVCTLLIGLAPAWQSSRGDIAETLKDTARAQGSSHGTRWRAGLVIGEVALSVALLVCSGLLLVSFARLTRTPPGFNPAGLATVFVGLPGDRYATGAQQDAFFQQAVAELRARPEVAAAAAVTGLPFSGFAPISPYTVRGQAVLPLPQRALAGLVLASPEYFETMQIPLRSGRYFDAHDRTDGAGVCIINESFARRLFPDSAAVGQAILRGRNADKVHEIVGVVADVRNTALNAPPQDIVYYPSAQLPSFGMGLVARTSGDPAALQAVFRSVVAAIDPNQPVAFFQTMDRLVAQTLGQQRILAWLTGTFAGVALSLAVVGLYSVLSHVVAQRTPEIGIRMALGAQPGDVVTMVLRQGLLLVGIGLVGGLVLAGVTSQFMRSLLYAIEPFSPLLYAGVALTFALVAVAACWLPAARASRIDPLVALRSE